MLTKMGWATPVMMTVIMMGSQTNPITVSSLSIPVKLTLMEMGLETHVTTVPMTGIARPGLYDDFFQNFEIS